MGTGAEVVDLAAILRRRAPAPPGTVVRRSGVVAPLVLLVVLSGAALWMFGELMEGRLDMARGKAALAVMAAPFLVLWWLWQTLRAVTWRLRGRFAWALSDAEVLFIDPWGDKVGPLPLALLTSLTYDFDPAVGPGVTVSLGYMIMRDGERVPYKIALPSLNGPDLLMSFTSPSDGRQFFEAVRERLMRVNPDAQIYPALSQPRLGNGLR